MQAIHFFDHEHGGPNRAVILRELQTPIGAGSDIAVQLIYDGLFVLVDRAYGTSTYDFPHRRFKEILASQYFDARDDRMKQIEKCLDRPDLTETLYVFFSISGYKDDILRAILDRTIGSEPQRYGDILVHCLADNGSTYKASAILEAFVLKAMDNGLRFSLPVAVLDFIENHSQLTISAGNHLPVALTRGDEPVATLACYLLNRYSRRLKDILLESGKLDIRDQACFYLIHSYLWGYDADYCIQRVNDLSPNSAEAIGLYYVIAENSPASELARRECLTLLTMPSFSDCALFCAILDGQNMGLVSRFIQNNLLSSDLEEFVALIRGQNNGIQTRYFVTHAMLDMVPEGTLKQVLERYVGRPISKTDMQNLKESSLEVANILKQVDMSSAAWTSATSLANYHASRLEISQFFHD